MSSISPRRALSRLRARRSRAARSAARSAVELTTLIDARLDAALARGRVAQTQDVWRRFKLRRPDGNLVDVLRGLNELYVRTERIENKLNLMLGQRAVSTTTEKPVRCTYRVPLPVPPAGETSTIDADELLLEVHYSMYVPKLLAENGIGGYEPSALPHFLAALQTAGPGAFFDVGANIGPYSLLARAFSDRAVVAFEPTPDLAEVARCCGALNGLAYDVEEIALGDTDGTAQLFLSDSTDSSNSLNPAFRAHSVALDVPLERLDSYVARTGTAPAVLKIDTETTEPAVLRGATEVVRRHRPWIFCEVLAGETERQLTEAVIDWGYTWYHLDGPGPLPSRAAIEGDPTMRDFMWLFAPEPVDESFWGRSVQWAEALAAAGPGELVAD